MPAGATNRIALSWLLLLGLSATLSASEGAASPAAAARESTWPYFGWTLAPIAGEGGRDELEIRAIVPGGPAARARLEQGDLVLGIAGTPLNPGRDEAASLSPISERARALLVAIAPGDRTLIWIRRASARHTVLIEPLEAATLLDEIPELALAEGERLLLLDDLMHEAEAHASAAELAEGMHRLALDSRASPTVRARAYEHLGQIADADMLAAVRATRVPRENLSGSEVVFVERARTEALCSIEDRLLVDDGLREIERVMRYVRHRYVDASRVGVADLTDAAIRGMLESLDPYCEYVPPELMRQSRHGLYAGIGIELIVHSGRAIVVAVEDGGPASGALKVDDEIIGIDGTTLIGATPPAVRDALHGEPGDDLVLQVRRPGVSRSLEITLVRSELEQPRLSSVLLPAGVAYLHLHSFSLGASEHFEAALDEFVGRDARALVLDLRGNYGGAVDEVQGIASCLLPPDQTICYSEGRSGFYPRRDLMTRPARVSWSKPLVVLVDGETASAAEMLAGALKEHERGLLIGATTFGKGIGQSTFDSPGVEGRRFVRLTTFRYYFPEAESIHGHGIVPDLAVDATFAREADTAFADLLATGALRRYVDALPEPHEPVLLRAIMRWGGSGDVDERFPGFAAWQATLPPSITPALARESLRRYVRLLARERLGGCDFVCDLEGDEAMRVAIEVLDAQVDLDLATHPAYFVLRPTHEETCPPALDILAHPR